MVTLRKSKVNGSSEPAAQSEITILPKHVAIIMDGNGRWGKERGLPRLAGHRAGSENTRRVIDAFAAYGVEFLTLYAFSTENWSRPRAEIRGLFKILNEVVEKETQTLHEKGVRIRHIGRLDRLPPELQQAIRHAVELTKDNSGMTLCVAFDYGGRSEIVEAIQKIIKNQVPPQEVTKELVDRYLYTADLPEPDLVIRTAGEMRLSNFLVWQSAYSEYYSTPTLWPDFDKGEVEKALIAYSKRQRKFGSLRPSQRSDRG